MLQVSKWDNVSILQSSLCLSVRQLSSTPNQKYALFLACSAICQSRMFQCELHSVGDIGSMFAFSPV